MDKQHIIGIVIVVVMVIVFLVMTWKREKHTSNLHKWIEKLKARQRQLLERKNKDSNGNETEGNEIEGNNY